MNDLGFSDDRHEPPRRAEGSASGGPWSYRPMGLTLTAGPVRTRALVLLAVPLLVLLVAFRPWGGWTGSGSGSASGTGGSSGAPAGFSDATPTVQATTPPGTGQDTTTPSYTPSFLPPLATTPPTASAATSGASPGATGSATPGGPDVTVARFYSAVNRRDYATAWILGGKNLDADYAVFVAGFAATRHDTLVTGAVQGDTVAVTLTSQQTDGSQHTFTGSYQVRGGTIVAGRLTQTS